MRATVRLAEAAPVTGGLLFELLAVEGEASEPPRRGGGPGRGKPRSEEHTSELQSRPHISYAVFCLKKKKQQINLTSHHNLTISHHHHITITRLT